jgi:hypothetical protein
MHTIASSPPQPGVSSSPRQGIDLGAVGRQQLHARLYPVRAAREQKDLIKQRIPREASELDQ